MAKITYEQMLCEVGPAFYFVCLFCFVFNEHRFIRTSVGFSLSIFKVLFPITIN